MISSLKKVSWTPNGYETTENSSEYTINYTPEEAFEVMRAIRNRLLSATDWWCVSDRTATPEQLAYRQALRDLPSTASPALDEDGNLTGVEWPNKPE